MYFYCIVLVEYLICNNKIIYYNFCYVNFGVSIRY